MSTLLLDSSILIDFLRQPDKTHTLLIQLTQRFNLSISIITHTELYAGQSVWEKPEARHDLELLFSGLNIVSLDETISTQAGQLRARYKLNLFDAIIAATALHQQLELVTLNLNHFAQIPGLKLFKDAH